jgi:cell division protein FtsW (lipid II flippase)
MVNGSFSRLRHYRWKELGLLVIPFMILLLGMIQLFLVAHVDNLQSSLTAQNLPTVYNLLPVLGLIAALLGVNVILSIFFPKADQMLLPLVGLLSGIGVLMATRLGPDICTRLKDGTLVCRTTLGSSQLLWVLIGLAVCLATLFILRNTNWLARYYMIAALFGILLVSVPVIKSFHTDPNSPTHDQLTFGPFNLQPSELLKICLVIFFAAYLSENSFMLAYGTMRIGRLRLPPLKQLGPLIIMLGLALLIFLIVRELGLALLIYGIFLCMIYLGSGQLRYVVTSLVFFSILSFIGYKLLVTFRLLGYVQDRFATLGIDVVNWPAGSDTLYFKSGLQVVQGLIALSSGGIVGAGLGLGHPTFVPVIESDMILTALGEELGLAGLFAIIGVYLLIIYRGYRIAMEATDPFSQLLAAGLTSIFALQTLIIAAGNIKVLPLTGIPLPFLSYGGSSIVANYIIVGILLRISHNSVVEREGMS